MAQPESVSEPPPPPLSPPSKHGFFRKLFGRANDSLQNAEPEPPLDRPADSEDPSRPGSFNRLSRRVVAGLPRAQTFKRQQSEQRVHLAPVELNPQERRTASVDRRSRGPRRPAVSQSYANPRVSAPGFIHISHQENNSATQAIPQQPPPVAEGSDEAEAATDVATQSQGADLTRDEFPIHDASSTADAQSITTSQYEALVHEELECTWILNLSMHFRDRSKREKFFVTYRESEHVWRRVTISLDYRDAPPNSLEMDLVHTEFQREKSAKIYEAIRESLPEIQFYDTVTNLKLQTTDGRLHVHVVEDGNEIISYPPVSLVHYLGCRRVKESDINFEAHMSGFVYRVNVAGRVLIKKEIPSPETIDEFLYEVNALHRLSFSDHVVRFYGVVVDDDDQRVKGLLISFAEQGALVDVIYDHCKEGGRGLAWPIKERWARQIVQGLADIHESGFVQGDFTLSNIVIDAAGDAKIIDINRRGCPVGWEPPEAAPLIESNQRISMYIGVKSDLFQLGMVLWGLAMEEDEPELQGRPLILGPEVGVPDWYRQLTEICLSYDPRMRLQASSLLRMIPPDASESNVHDRTLEPASISVDDGYSLRNYLVDEYGVDGHPHIKTVQPPSEWSYVSRRYESPSPYQPYYHTRGRSPPSPLPSNIDRSESPRGRYGRTTWAANINIAPSYSDVGADELPPYGVPRQPTPTPTIDKIPLEFLEGSPNDITMKRQEKLEAIRTDSWDLETPRGEETPDVHLKELQGDGDDAEKEVSAEEVAGSHKVASNKPLEHNEPLSTFREGVEAPPEDEPSGVDKVELTEMKPSTKLDPIATGGAEVEEKQPIEGTEAEENTALDAPGIEDTAAEETETVQAEMEEKSLAMARPPAGSPTNSENDTSVPRTVHIPESLAGIDAGHETTEAERREDDEGQGEDFTTEPKTSTGPALIATTETNA